MPADSRWCGYAPHHQSCLERLTLFTCDREHVCLGLVRYDDGAYELVDEDGEAVARGYAIDAIVDSIEGVY